MPARTASATRAPNPIHVFLPTRTLASGSTGGSLYRKDWRAVSEQALFGRRKMRPELHRALRIVLPPFQVVEQFADAVDVGVLVVNVIEGRGEPDRIARI